MSLQLHRGNGKNVFIFTSTCFVRWISAHNGDPPEPIFNKILVANRGEIACRIINTARKMGIKTVAVFSDADIRSKHVKLADEAVHIGKPEATDSYLNIPRIVNAAKSSGAQAVHPGYGFLSENPQFVQALESNGITFIGPSQEIIKFMGDKLESKRLATAAGMSTVPGYDGIVSDVEQCVRIAKSIGYPVMMKASAGGGGKGMRIVYNDDETSQGFVLASQEAMTSFKDNRIILEKYIELPRHIEVQILGDKHGNVVHLFDRECSVQRRNQKIIEEAPSTFLDEATRNKMTAQAVAFCKKLHYTSAGTIEFLVDTNRNFYFLEMNTRLQVEHAVTEFITGIDIVQEMIRISKGYKLPLTQEDVKMNGWAIESRVYAENPFKDFGTPNTGRINSYIEPPCTKSVRCDSGVEEGSEISIYYDSMISKLISHGQSRGDAITSSVDALDRYTITGVSHNIPMLRDILTEKNFSKGNINTSYLNSMYPTGYKSRPLPRDKKLKLISIMVALYVSKEQKSREYLNEQRILTHGTRSEEWALTLMMGEECFEVEVRQKNGFLYVEVEGKSFELPKKLNVTSPVLEIVVDDEEMLVQHISTDGSGNCSLRYQATVHSAYILTKVAHNCLKYVNRKPHSSKCNNKTVRSPIPGLVKKILCNTGDYITKGDQLCIVEAMKMQNFIHSTSHGKIKNVLVTEGVSVGEGDAVVIFE